MQEITLINVKKRLLTGILSMIISNVAHAECRRSYVCDDYDNNCRYIDICDDSLDLPSIDLDPLPSLPSLELKPLPSLELPPLGTSQCEYKLIDGKWQNVCW